MGRQRPRHRRPWARRAKHRAVALRDGRRGRRRRNRRSCRRGKSRACGKMVAGAGGGRRRLRVRLLVCIALAACYAPDERSCRLRCGDDGACPTGMHCQETFCALPGTAPGACCPFAEPGTLYVDGAANIGVDTGSAVCPFITISDAARLAASTPGTTIHVAAGTYSESTGEQFPIDLRGGTSLIGAGAGVTIVDGGFLREFQMSWRMTLLIGDELETSRLSGVTVRNSTPPPTPAWGAGIV